MNETTSNLLTVCAATVLLAVALSACGGGGDGPMTGGETMPPDDGETMMPDDGGGMVTEFGDDGLIAGPGASPEAMGPADTLANMALRGEDFAPVLAPVKVDDSDTNPRIVLPEEDDQAYVKSVALDGPSRFTITYVVNGQEAEVEFGPEHLTIDGFYREVNNTQFWMWNAATTYNGEPVSRQYFTLVGWQADDLRGYAAAGVLTHPHRLESLGSATYTGQMVVDLWANGTAQNLFGNLGRLWGEMNLNAKFRQ